MEKNIIILVLVIALLGQNIFLVKRVSFLESAIVNHFHLHESRDLLDKLKDQQNNILNPNFHTTKPFNLLHNNRGNNGEPERIR